jgi:Methyltransferase domain
VRFDEEWMSQGQLDVLGALAQSTSYLDGAVIEIGTWQGRSAVPIANAVRPDLLHVVDHWEGDQHIAPELSARDNFGIFLANMEEGTEGNFRVWKMGWREFARRWDKPIRFLHLDAAHTTEEVADNIAALLPHAVPGAIFAGDDWNWPTVAAGVRQHFGSEHIAVKFDKLWWVVLSGDVLAAVR